MVSSFICLLVTRLDARKQKEKNERDKKRSYTILRREKERGCRKNKKRIKWVWRG